MTALNMDETPHTLERQRIWQKRAVFSKRGQCVDCDCWTNDFSQFRVFLMLRSPKETSERMCTPGEIWEGDYEFYFEILYFCESMPDALFPHQHQFQRCVIDFAGDTFEGWQFTHGGPLNEYNLQRRKTLIDDEVTAKRTAILQGKCASYRPLTCMPCARVSVAEMARIVKNQSCLVYMGAGISASRFMYNASINKAIGRVPDAEVDDQVVSVVTADQGRSFVASVYSRGLYLPLVNDSEPTMAHKALARMVLASSWPVITTNSDLLLEYAGASAMQVGGMTASVEGLMSEEFCRKLTMLMCIGVGGDHRHVVKSFRNRCPGCPVVALVCGDVGEYILTEDRVLEGDVQETLPQLVALVLNDPL